MTELCEPKQHDPRRRSLHQALKPGCNVTSLGSTLALADL